MHWTAFICTQFYCVFECVPIPIQTSCQMIFELLKNTALMVEFRSWGDWRLDVNYEYSRPGLQQQLWKQYSEFSLSACAKSTSQYMLIMRNTTEGTTFLNGWRYVLSSTKQLGWLDGSGCLMTSTAIRRMQSAKVGSKATINPLPKGDAWSVAQRELLHSL